jgi:hypothetical protein
MEYEQRLILKFVFNDGLDMHQITEKLSAQFNEDAYSLRTVESWVGELRRGRSDFHNAPRSGGPLDEHLATRILELLRENPFESIRSRAETLQVSQSAVLQHPHKDLHYKSFYLRWVPQLLTPELRERRCRYASEMTPLLIAAARDEWHYLVMGDESSFFWTYSHRRMWTLTTDDVAIKPKKNIQTKKLMSTIFWSPLGFPAVDELAAGAKMDNDYFITNVLAQVERKMFPDGRTPHAKRLTVHWDNCSVHINAASQVCLAEHSMIGLKHLPYSRDLAPSDFYLFSTLKERLKDIEVVDEEDLLNRLKEILNESPRKKLGKVLEHGSTGL